MTLLNAGLQLFAMIVLLLSGHLVTNVPERPRDWSVSESIDILPTLHCWFELREGEFSGTCGRDAPEQR